MKPRRPFGGFVTLTRGADLFYDYKRDLKMIEELENPSDGPQLW